DWIRAAFAGVPIDEAKMILGDNAIECFRLDRTTLESIASEIGPRADELLGDHTVREPLLDHFHSRGGFHKPPLPFDPNEISRRLSQDIAGLAHTGSAT